MLDPTFCTFLDTGVLFIEEEVTSVTVRPLPSKGAHPGPSNAPTGVVDHVGWSALTNGASSIPELSGGQSY